MDDALPAAEALLDAIPETIDRRAVVQRVRQLIAAPAAYPFLALPPPKPLSPPPPPRPCSIVASALGDGRLDDAHDALVELVGSTDRYLGREIRDVLAPVRAHAATLTAPRWGQAVRALGAAGWSVDYPSEPVGAAAATLVWLGDADGAIELWSAAPPEAEVVDQAGDLSSMVDVRLLAEAPDPAAQACVWEALVVRLEHDPDPYTREQLGTALLALPTDELAPWLDRLEAALCAERFNRLRDVLEDLARHYLRRGELDEAEARYRHAMEVTSRPWSTLLERAVDLSDVGVGDADGAWAAALEAAPARRMGLVAREAAQRGRVDVALDALAVASGPQELGSVRWRIAETIGPGDSEAARRLFQVLVGLDTVTASDVCAAAVLAEVLPEALPWALGHLDDIVPDRRTWLGPCCAAYAQVIAAILHRTP